LLDDDVMNAQRSNIQTSSSCFYLRNLILLTCYNDTCELIIQDNKRATDFKTLNLTWFVTFIITGCWGRLWAYVEIELTGQSKKFKNITKKRQNVAQEKRHYQEITDKRTVTDLKSIRIRRETNWLLILRKTSLYLSLMKLGKHLRKMDELNNPFNLQSWTKKIRY
jgi:hypothetical protein